MSLSRDHLPTIRKAVAEVVRQTGMASLADRYEAGELDTQPIMQAAVASADDVVAAMFQP